MLFVCVLWFSVIDLIGLWVVLCQCFLWFVEKYARWDDVMGWVGLVTNNTTLSPTISKFYVDEPDHLYRYMYTEMGDLLIVTVHRPMLVV